MREDIIIGKNPVEEALTSGRSVNKVLLAEKLNPHVQRKFIRMSKEAGTIVQKVPKKKLDQLAGHHQGVIAYVAPYRYRTLDDLLKRAEEKQEAPFFVILDEKRGFLFFFRPLQQIIKCPIAIRSDISDNR